MQDPNERSHLKNVLEVQGIVSAAANAPLVQVRFTDENGDTVPGANTQMTPDEAREHAQMVVEAAANAVYEAALVTWLLEEMKVDENVVFEALTAMRNWRSDKWGQPTIPEDWRQE